MIQTAPQDDLSHDPFVSPQIAALIEKAGIGKARLALVPLLTLGILAGAFIALGAMLFTLVTSGNGDAFGLNRLAGGWPFRSV